jgi:hypothetical protein
VTEPISFPSVVVYGLLRIVQKGFVYKEGIAHILSGLAALKCFTSDGGTNHPTKECANFHAFNSTARTSDEQSFNEVRYIDLTVRTVISLFAYLKQPLSPGAFF